MQSFSIPQDLPNHRSLRRNRTDARASRLSLNFTRQTSKFQGNVSLIRADIKTINRNMNLLPLQNDTMKSIKGRLIYFIENASGFSMNNKIKENFRFQLGKVVLPREVEGLSLEEMLKKHVGDDQQHFEGDVLKINFLLVDTDTEYQMIKNNLEKFKKLLSEVIFLVKQQNKKKNKMKNRFLRIEENTEDCTVTIYNIRGDLQEAYPIQILKSEVKNRTKIQNISYYPLCLSNSYENPKDAEEHDPSPAEIFFLSQVELSEFLEKVNTFKQFRKNSGQEAKGDHLLESIQDLGAEEEEDDLDEDVKVCKTSLLELKLDARSKSSGPAFRSLYESAEYRSKTISMYGSNLEKGGQKLSNLEKDLMSNKSGNNGPSPIAKVLMEKKGLELDTHEFEVKIKGYFGINYKRILRVSEDFEFHFFKKEKGKYIFTLSVPINNLAKLQPKKTSPLKVYFIRKIDKKEQKPIKVLFKDNQDLRKFFHISKKIAELFNSSANSFQTEKERANGEKLYPWLMGPKSMLTNIHYDENGRLVSMQFHVINLSNSQEPQIIHIDLVSSSLSLKTVNSIIQRESFKGVVRKKINIRNILYCGVSFKDVKCLNLLLKNREFKLLFPDNKSRIFFESAIYNTTLYQYKIMSKQPFKWDPITVFCTTFNAGFGMPPADLAPWLGKTNNCDLIAIGMQEADTAEWLEAIQEYYLSANFTLVALVTMWKMLLCVFVSSKYSEYIANVEVGSKATGIAKVIGNKGGVGVSFKLLKSSFCFISCHLAAQPERMPTRKANFYSILKNIRLGDESVETCGLHDYFFFMGDTNFRLDYDFFKAIDVINEGNHVSLLPHDQYRKAREEDNFMTLFKEGEITFKPTYRRNRNDTGYSNKRNQSPSWTDRIFIKDRVGHPVIIEEYNSAEMFFLSDHRPVYGIYKCELQPPYLPRTPIYTRPSGQRGVIKIVDLELEYDFGLYTKMGEFENPLVFPITMAVGFRAKFLDKAAVTMPLELKGIPSTNLVWNEEMLPLLYSIIPDFRFLRNQNLLAVIKLSRKVGLTSENVTGTADISFADLMINNGTRTEFKAPIFYYGRYFGVLRGNLIYDLN